MGEMHSTKMLPCSVLSVKSVTGYHMISDRSMFLYLLYLFLNFIKWLDKFINWMGLFYVSLHGLLHRLQVVKRWRYVMYNDNALFAVLNCSSFVFHWSKTSPMKFIWATTTS